MISNIIFRFLRQFLYDKELEETKLQLAQSKVLLAEYKDFIQNEKKNQDNEAETKKVDPDFLVMIWASLGLALSVGVEAISNLPKEGLTVENITGEGFANIAWLIITLVVVFYLSLNTTFALNLTLDYAKSKTDTGYAMFARSLITGAIIVFICLVVVGYLQNN